MSSSESTAEMTEQDIYHSGEYWERNDGFHEEDGLYKADHCLALLKSQNLLSTPLKVVDVGCGSGRFLYELAGKVEGEFLGVDVSDQSVSTANAKHRRDNLSFVKRDVFEIGEKFDLVTMNDVFEHVEDYIGFLRMTRQLGTYFYFNIPLDMTALSVLRNSYMKWRDDVGHLHYFSKNSALATLEYAGYEILDHQYNNYVLHEVKTRRTVKNVLGALPRLATFKLAPDFSVNLLGGASLGVLCR